MVFVCEVSASERIVLMRSNLIMVLLSVLMVAACSSSPTQQPKNDSQTLETGSPATGSPASQPGVSVAPAEAAAAKPKLDACALLTSKEVETVQGEALKETKLSGQSSGGFNISQCFFTLPTFTNSISLLVAQRAEGAGAKDPKEYFRDTFHEDSAKNKDRDKKKDEEEEGAPPQKVSGVGDEAYWLGSRVGGALYVLKRNAYVRISVGGPADQATKIKRSKALAQKALARL
jgi:hypothetical protein